MKLEKILIHCEAVKSYQKGIFEIVLSDVKDGDDAAIANYKKYVEDQSVAMANELAAALPADPVQPRKAVRPVVSTTVQAPYYGNKAGAANIHSMPHSNGPASVKALGYARRLGYTGPDNITSEQCNEIINQFKANPNGAVNRGNANYQQQMPVQMPQQQQPQGNNDGCFDFPDDADQGY